MKLLSWIRNVAVILCRGAGIKMEETPSGTSLSDAQPSLSLRHAYSAVKNQFSDRYFYENKDGKWFFWNETWSGLIGPEHGYESRAEAEYHFSHYTWWLNQPSKEDRPDYEI